MRTNPGRSAFLPYATLFRSRLTGPTTSSGVVNFVSRRANFAPPVRASRAKFALLLTKFTTPERWEEHTSELQSRQYLVCRLLLEKKHTNKNVIDKQSFYQIT